MTTARSIAADPHATADRGAAHLDAVERPRAAALARIRRCLGASAPAWLADFPDEAPDEPSSSRERAGGRPDERLDPRDARLVAGIGLIEEDVRFGALFAGLQDPLPARRPCVGLLTRLLADPDDDPGEFARRIHALARRGIVEIDNAADPRSEWIPRLPVAIWDLLRSGRVVAASLPPRISLRPAASFPDLADVVLVGEIARVAPTLPDLIRVAGISALVLRGMAGSGRLTLFGALARELGQDVLVYDAGLADAGVGVGVGVGDSGPAEPGWPLFVTLAGLGAVFPVVVASGGPGETRALPPALGLNRPLGVVLSRTATVTGPALERAVSFTLLPCSATERRAIWGAAALIEHTHADEIATSFRLTPGNIHRAGELATAAAAAAGRVTVAPGDVRAATRLLQRQALPALATRLDAVDPDDPPVLSATGSAELALLLARCRHREQLADDGPDAGANRGVRALFSGPSGTGKTLTARHVAARLHLDIYRLDLAAVVDKYIGETERKLERVLARAEELDVVLLLDEGDALMTKRTDVSSATDRYANLETNFLLQRLETFDGIVIITTNAGSRIDRAFLRRIDVTIDFVPPDAEQRWLLWRQHLPAGHDVSTEQLTDVARRCELTGGQIRNATVSARLFALERDRPVDDDDLIAALAREYRRAGASFPLAGPSPGPVRRRG